MSKLCVCTFILAICGWQSLSSAAITLTVRPETMDRRLIVVDQLVPGRRIKPPFKVIDTATGKPIPIQTEQAAAGTMLHFIIPELPANQSATFTIEQGQDQSPAVMHIEEKDGYLSFSDASHEITRYNFGPQFAQFKKQFFWPVNVAGVHPVRDWPMSDARPDEPHDHPHHTGVYFAYGDVNGKEYWSKLPITHDRFTAKESGPVFARLGVENHWGDDLIELQDIRILNVGSDAVVMDWTETMKAPADKTVVLGKTKEGGMSVRVTDGISFKDPKADGETNMLDSLGNRGEKAIRNEKLAHPSAAWADDTGTVDGKTVGVTIMNHPTSFRFPTDWHVRAYGLFTANPFFLQGEYTLKPSQSITLKYRIYFHAGTPDQAHVAAVFNGYASNKADLK